MTPPSAAGPASLNQAGAEALRRGDPATARRLFERATAAGGGADSWLGLALSARAGGDAAAALAAADRALQLDPRSLRALMLKGDHLAENGDGRGAAAFYRAVTTVAAGARLPPDLAREAARAQTLLDRYSGDYAAHLEAALARDGVSDAAGPRFRRSVDVLLGRTQVHLQEPRFFYFPELPQRAFYEREAFAWLPALEAATPAIRAELDALLATPEAFAPYVQAAADRPATGGQGLIGNPDWSAAYLWKDGRPNTAVADRCPRTMAALSGAPLYQAPGRSPSALFSLLRPGMRIPPHNGFVNTRLICHLPLRAPEGCALRVGAETRPWVEGRALVFDDSVEHEAWNRSGELRVVLLFDIERPELTVAEREAVRALFAAVDAYGPRIAWSA